MAPEMKKTAENFAIGNKNFPGLNVKLAEILSENLFAVGADKSKVDDMAEKVKKKLFPEKMSDEDREAQTKMLAGTIWLAVHKSKDVALLFKIELGKTADILPEALKNMNLEKYIDAYQKAFNEANGEGKTAPKAKAVEETGDADDIGSLLDEIKNKGVGSNPEDTAKEGEGEKKEEKKEETKKEEKKKEDYKHKGKKAVLIGKDGKEEEVYIVGATTAGKPVVDRLIGVDWKTAVMEYVKQDEDTNTFIVKEKDITTKKEEEKTDDGDASDGARTEVKVIGKDGAEKEGYFVKKISKGIVFVEKWEKGKWTTEKIQVIDFLKNNPDYLSSGQKERDEKANEERRKAYSVVGRLKNAVSALRGIEEK